MNQQAFRAKNGFQVNGAETRVNQSLVFGGKTISELLFTQNEPGFTFLANPETCFTDVAGTTNAGPGEPVALWLDQSGNDNHATQPTSANRPILGRKPKGGRRNLLERTEELNTSPWSTAAATQANVGTFEGRPIWRVQSTSEVNAAARVLQSISTNVSDITITLAARPSHNLISFQVAPSIAMGFDVNLKEFTISGFPGQLPDVVHEATELSDGFWLLKVTVNQIEATDFRLFPDRAQAGTDRYLDVNLIQVEAASEPTPYQRVGSQFDVTEAGKPDRHYLFFGGEADPRWMQTPTITPGTDKVQVFAGVRKLSDAVGWSLSFNGLASDGSFNMRLPFSGAEDRFFFRLASDFASVSVNNPQPFSGVYSGLGGGDPLAVFRVNGTEAGTANANITTSLDPHPVFIGQRGNSSEYFNGEISALSARFGPNLATEQINRVESITAYHVAEPTI